jgi:redox-sensitive bicupin YhaK (pirin superfamily)
VLVSDRQSIDMERSDWMITLRPSHDRGHTTLSWLESAHTFSFNNYVDPRHMGFRQLRVINDDWVKPGVGFGTHSHRDMEIITYVLEGALEHRDSTGNGSVIRPGDVQRMSAGTGISHSEFNHSPTRPVHFLQIWILPARQGREPGYEQRSFTPAELRGQWRLIAARDGRDAAVVVHQDVDVLAAQLEPGEQVTYRLQPGRHAWVQLARGSVSLNDVSLKEGDGAAVSEVATLDIRAVDRSEVLLFDLT